MKPITFQNNNLNNLNNSYSLTNLNNYKKNLENDIVSILDKFLKLEMEFIKYILEIHKIKNICYKKFIIIRGLETIIHVFNFILLYTNNLEITNYHTHKAIYFYVEFIQQISSDENSFLQLNSNDAIMYVYKKTIFEINNEFRKNTNNSLKKENNKDLLMKIDTINNLLSVLKNILIYILNTQEDLKFLDTSLNIYEEICLSIINSKLNMPLSKVYLLIVKNLSTNQISNEKYLYINKLLVKLINSCISEKEIELYLMEINNLNKNSLKSGLNMEDEIQVYLENKCQQ